ncbi:FecCD family ABC transporter permease [Kallotenue papyrolyticum]|uniref:FecCD family ABC transporter permease n=1 Tax=Kallotenue papyrolyticum TaxID=1325125 RepID=UPI0004786467|nr:iron ABC transporter permease [Kallotenue papyrolyticum]
MTAGLLHTQRTHRRRRPWLWLGLPLAGGVLALALLASVAFGAAEIDAATVWRALTAFDGSTDHLIIRTLRVPRAIIGALVGAALSVAGAIMQGLTRNPLADPGVLGINTGAALAVVAAVFLFNIASLRAYALCAFAGAGLTALVVYGLGSFGRDGPTPLKLTIAGAAVTAFLSSITTGILLFNQRTLDEVRFWLAGSIAGRDLALLVQVLPYLAVGLSGAVLLGRQITTLALGDEVATGLGQRTAWIKAFAALLVVLLAGSAVAVAGPIGFVGLVIPHVVRFFVGMDYRWILPYAALSGAIFLVLADIAARLVLRPTELPVGVMTALIGGPFFVYLVRWRVRR